MTSIYHFQTTGPHKIQVGYTGDLDGGGTWFGQEYVEVLSRRYPDQPWSHCLEWCSGPAFIGFSLLDHGLCQALTVNDIHAPALSMVQNTVRGLPPSLQHCVNSYHTGDITAIPTSVKFDLVVGNPPHFPSPSTDTNVSRIESDPDWLIHRNFFANIKSYLDPGALILLQENWSGSRPETFAPFVREAGLLITDWWHSEKWFDPQTFTQIYYLEIRIA